MSVSKRIMVGGRESQPQNNNPLGPDPWTQCHCLRLERHTLDQTPAVEL